MILKRLICIKGWIINSFDMRQEMFTYSYQTLDGKEYLMLESYFDNQDDGFYVFRKE